MPSPGVPWVAAFIRKAGQTEASGFTHRSGNRCWLSAGLPWVSSHGLPSSCWLDMLPYVLPQGKAARLLTASAHRLHLTTFTKFYWSKQDRGLTMHGCRNIDATLCREGWQSPLAKGQASTDERKICSHLYKQCITPTRP